MSLFLKLLAWLIAGVLLLGVFGWLNSPLSPVAWTPDPNPGFNQEYAPNNALAAMAFLAPELGVGPEAIAVGSAGRLFTGLADGRIMVVDLRSGEFEEFANTAGRPLGLKFDANGDLIVADAYRGLLRITPAGEKYELVSPRQLKFADDLDIAADGTIWLSDASGRYGYDEALLDFIDGRPTGRLLSYHPETKQLTTHMEGLAFANGVALGPDDEYVMVSETGRARIQRLWLSGPRVGQRDIVIDELPAHTDNITFNGQDLIWVALPGPRDDSIADQLILRKILGGLPVSWWKPRTRFGFILGINPDGEVEYNLQYDDTVGFSEITSVVQHRNTLYVGSLIENKIGVLNLDDLR